MKDIEKRTLYFPIINHHFTGHAKIKDEFTWFSLSGVRLDEWRQHDYRVGELPDDLIEAGVNLLGYMDKKEAFDDILETYNNDIKGMQDSMKQGYLNNIRSIHSYINVVCVEISDGDVRLIENPAYGRYFTMVNDGYIPED